MLRFFPSLIAFALCSLIYSPSFAANINAPQLTPPEERVARGILRAKQTANLTARMSGQLLEAPYKPGQFFKSGALLAKFDCTLEEAELAAMMKKHQTYTMKYKNAAELFSYGAAGEFEVALLDAERQQALAEANVLKTQLKHCEVYAPFSGYVTIRHVSAFESPQQGHALYSLEKAASLELSVIVPSKWMKWLRRGHHLDFAIDETGELIQAKVIRLSATIDPVSQTVEIIAKPTSKSSALSGMSGYARFKPVQ